MLFVAGHRNVAGQRARMSRAFSLKVSAPLSTTRDYHARLSNRVRLQHYYGGKMKFIHSAMLSLAMTMAMTGCSNSGSEDSTNATINAAMQASAAADAAMAQANAAIANAMRISGETTAPVDADKVASICKAAIAELFGHSPKIMKAAPQGGGIVRISYRRPDDGKLFKNDCQLQGNHIMWRGFDISPGSGPGRWRNNPADEVLTFKVKGKTVELLTTYSDGSTATAKQPLL